MSIFNQNITEIKNTAWVRGDGTGFKADDNKSYVYRYTDPTSSSAIHSGIIFDPVTIPQGSTINSAYIELYGNYTSEWDAYFHLFGNDVDDAADFTVELDIYTRARTTANVAYTGENISIGYWGSAFDITTIIQEIIDRVGWASGQAICLLLIGDTGSSKQYRYGDVGNPPRIHIDYTATVLAVPGHGALRTKRIINL